MLEGIEMMEGGHTKALYARRNRDDGERTEEQTQIDIVDLMSRWQ